MEQLFEIGKVVSQFDTLTYASFDEDTGALNLEWMSSNGRVGMAVDPDEGLAWWYVCKDVEQNTGPLDVFDDRFRAALLRVSTGCRNDDLAKRRKENRQNTRNQSWRIAFIALATFNAIFWLLLK